jgi:hypothetical protein
MLLPVAAWADVPAPHMSIELPDGEVAPGEPLVVRGYPGPAPYVPRVLVDGKPIAVDVKIWRDLMPDPVTQTFYLLAPKGDWPKGGKRIVVKAQYLPDLEARIGQTPDKTAPTCPRFGEPQAVTRDYPMFGTRSFVQIPYEKQDDRSPVLHLTLRLKARGIGRTKDVEVQTVLVPNAAGMLALPADSPTCIVGGTITDPSGNTQTLPPAPCPSTAKSPPAP